MDLPTYTNIWRIEKRLYKLYDLRLPMPLPIVWIGVFVGVLVPWSLLLLLIGVNFEAPWHVLYLVPPGVVTWLSTRPVIENKRLTELLQSQLRYLGEPRMWCRMAPDAEPDEIIIVGRVWRAAPRKRAAAAAPGRARIKGGHRARHAAGSRRAAHSTPRQVRPAVAAAAAAGTAPLTESTPATWGVRPTAASTPPPLATAKAAAESPPPVGDPASGVGATAPETAVPESAATIPNREAGTPAERRTDPPAPDPAAPVTEGAAEPATPPPIGAEALRRLRKLAASAQTGSTEPQSHDETAPTGHRPTPPIRALPRIPEAPAPDTPEQAPQRDLPRIGVPRLAKLDAPGTPVETGAGPEREATPQGEPATVPAESETPQETRHRQEPALFPVEGGEAGTPHEPAALAGEERTPREEPVALPGKGRRHGGAAVGRVSIRAVPADAGVPSLPLPGPADAVAPAAPARPRRVESVVGRDPSGGWRRLAQVVIGSGGSRTDRSEVDEARARSIFAGSRRIVVLGCTGGAGQTTTALMLGHTLAQIRDDRVVAVDANTGENTLTSRVRADSPETLTSLLGGLDRVSGYLSMRSYTSRMASGLEVIGADTDADAAQRLADGTLFSDARLGQVMEVLDRHYKLIIIDPAAALAARVLPYADQLILVVPASEDGPDAVAMTYEWLDGHGCADLRRRAIMVVNGVSRRSMSDVEQAEAVARGRCRAIVRVPWEDDLSPDRTEPIDPTRLRWAGRRAYLALAGVVVAGFVTPRSRKSEEELAQ